MTRDEIIEAIRAADARLEALAPRIRDAGDRPLASGDWRVRDAMSHVAARGNPVPRTLARLNQATDAAGNPQPVRDIHEINAEQVRDRTHADVDDLVRETRDGHRQALTDLEDVDDDVLERRLVVAFPPGELSVAEFIHLAGPRHEGNHLNDIEAVLGDAASR
ncbi:MAG: maleylpyruvate isomerase N-terminal domain-containing protein [Dehalococcoidia bacterium]|nr:maleylpyruvate isomerase N-terminal domain-containing protein [Dehalococcoidia bacterium]HRC62750.1 maleylpyruvate isomerase N-terminal domain-containing protein [Dehalococcoidia bacterium]